MNDLTSVRQVAPRARTRPSVRKNINYARDDSLQWAQPHEPSKCFAGSVIVYVFYDLKFCFWLFFRYCLLPPVVYKGSTKFADFYFENNKKKKKRKALDV